METFALAMAQSVCARAEEYPVLQKRNHSVPGGKNYCMRLAKNQECVRIV